MAKTAKARGDENAVDMAKDVVAATESANLRRGLGRWIACAESTASLPLPRGCNWFPEIWVGRQLQAIAR